MPFIWLLGAIGVGLIVKSSVDNAVNKGCDVHVNVMGHSSIDIKQNQQQVQDEQIRQAVERYVQIYMAQQQAQIQQMIDTSIRNGLAQWQNLVPPDTVQPNA